MFRMPVAESGPRSATPAAEQPPGDTFLSWEDDAPPAIAPRRETSAETPMASVPPDEVTHVRPVNRPPPPGAASAPPFVASPAGSPAVGPAAVAGDELARAFADGLGLDRPPLASLTPEAMVQIGRLLREATQGTLDLLMARALTKREVRAEGTMIVGKDNNPLKFSPSVEAALAHLLAPQGRGFLPPIEAMRDAYDDLRSHQFGFMAGLRAALAGVLKRFDPSVLEQRIAHKTVFDSVLPINRRAKLWDLYEHLYREIAREAEDDFHTLFGREFLRAYEEQVARLEDSRGSADPPVPPAPGPRR